VNLHQTVYAGFPTRWGIRFARVPSVTVAAATLAELRRVEKLVGDHPHLALLACGCTPCTLHRNLLKAWLQARAFDAETTD